MAMLFGLLGSKEEVEYHLLCSKKEAVLSSFDPFQKFRQE